MSDTENSVRELRNQVFSNNSNIPAGVDPRQQSISAVESVKAEFGLDIPIETIPLASKGLVYPKDHPLHMKESIEIRAMTAREEDILTSRNFLKKGTVITELIRSCLVDKRINPADLIAGDRNTLMVAIRITGYGPEYDCEIDCDECEAKKVKHSFDLSQLPIKFLEIEPVEAGSNLFVFKLPYTQKTVKFKLLTGRDEEEILAMNERMKKHGLNNDTGITTSLIYAIDSVDGVTDKNKISQFIRMMPARDSLALRSYIRDNDPGIQMKQEATCDQCGHTAEVDVPLGVTFLWPHAGR